ncbi:MAG: hypothetical protein EOO07_02015 [Chitinophagaceae bacterium]|nr:MAG: hypothetical protein EOO07_02015 [Chitinophagaceae bacterium]
MERFCLECNSLVQGRADKKFCDDHCRSSFNHRIKVEDLGFVNSVNQILKKNRTILKNQHASTASSVKREQLLIKGFDFNHYTYSYMAKDGGTYFFCYEYGYLLRGNGELIFAKREGN